MHYEVLFLALTTSLLNLDDSHRGQAFLSVETSFEGLEFRKLRVKGHTSIGARVRPDRDLSLYDWIESQRKQGLCRAGVPLIEASAELAGLLNGLSPMQQQAYHSGSLRMIACEFQSEIKYYILEMESSAPHLMTAEKFGDLLVDQPASEAICAALLQEIRINNESAVLDVDQLHEFFYSRAGARAFATNGDSFLLVAQSAAQQVGSRFVVPESEEESFTIGDNAESLHTMLGGAAEEFIAFEDLLILRGETTTSELARLFDAQTCGPAVWERVAASLVRIGELKPNLKQADWRKSFLALDPEKAEIYSRSFIQALQEACRACNCHVRVTDEFEGRLVTYLESLDTQARAGHVPSEQRMHFAQNCEPWNHFYFSELASAITSASANASGASQQGAANGSIQIGKTELPDSLLTAQHAMRLGYAFATRIGSEYAKIFALVNMILSVEAAPLFEGRIAIDDFLFELQIQGHDHDMQARLESSWSLMELFRELKLSPLQIQGLCASSLADVFDGIGDWNDSYFEDPADQKEFEEVSQMVYQAVQTLQVTALNIQEMGAN